MRLTLVILVATATAAHAGPPSKTLERAIKLYDKKDFMSAHIELGKVIAGESGDDAENVERAEFFAGKTLYQMGYYVPANAMFEKITLKGATHHYYTAALKWYAALADLLPVDLNALDKYAPADLADPTLTAVKDQLAYLRGLIATNYGKFPEAAKELATVDKSSKLYLKARLALGFVHVRTTKWPEAIATFASIPAGSDTGDLAALAVAQLHMRAKAWDKAIAAYAQVRATGPLGPRAAWESSWAKLEKAGKAPTAFAAAATTPVLAVDGPDPALLPALLAVDLCAVKPPISADALAGYRADAAATKKQLAALIAEDGDHAEFFAKRVSAHAGTMNGLPKRVQALAKLALAGPTMTRSLAFIAELDRELGLLGKADKAYQTTQGAAEVLQELTIQKSLAEADAGKIAGDRLQRMARELDQLAPSLAVKIPVGTGGLAVACP
jgi:tetratricopeptide (TPR) repeat protein